MLGAVLLFGVLAGVDNLQVCSSVGLLPMEGRRRHQMAAAFALCESAAPLVGLLIGHLLLRAFLGVAPLLILACGAGILIFRGQVENLFRGRMLFGLPVSLSFDNLLGGAGISALNYPMIPAALLIGAISAAMSCAGWYFGGWLRGAIRWRVARWCLEPAVGAYLCVLAVRLLLASRS